MPRYPVIAISIVSWVVIAGCDTRPQEPRAPVLGTAWAGPVTLSLHKEIDPKSPVIGIAHHGDKLDIVGRRRSAWYRVRTARGVEGWTSNRELLDAGQMERLKALALETAGMPSQGLAATFGTLNVHSEPNRQSTSFLQLGEHEKFDTIAHRVEARSAPPKRELIADKPKVVRKSAKKDKKEKDSVPLPPAPPAPLPPSDWVSISAGREPQENIAPPAESAPVAKDDWTLIRTREGQSGWVLTSAIYLLIPDEVAQYAEGHRITSYFSVGKIKDSGEQKDIWLWTTSERLGGDYDFDSFRVFTWSLRHHRYETAYIQRRERGFFPVLAKTGQFSVCIEGSDGARMRHQYVLDGNAVKGAGVSPCTKAVDVDAPEQDLKIAAAADEPSPAAPQGTVAKLKARVMGLFERKP